MAANPLDVNLDVSDEKCMICLENLSTEQQYSLPECSHTFHQNCIMQWFRSGSHKCPLCNNLGVNDSMNANSHLNHGSWYARGKHKYKMIRQYSRKKEAPLLLKKEIEKLKKLELKKKNLRKEMKEFKNKVGTFKELNKEWNNYRNKRWRLDSRIRQKKMAIANFNIIPIIIATKVDVNNN